MSSFTALLIKIASGIELYKSGECTDSEVVTMPSFTINTPKLPWKNEFIYSFCILKNGSSLNAGGLARLGAYE